MNRQELIAWAIATAVCVGTVGTGAVVANVIMDGDTKEISIEGMSAEQIRLLELWMGIE
jgi:hypothetical protein